METQQQMQGGVTGAGEHRRARTYETEPFGYRDVHGERAASALGWLSLALGAAEVGAPRRVERLIGLAKSHTRLLRVLGVREAVAGAGILSRRRPRGWLWARVAGDALDLALLGAAFRSPRARRDKLAATTAAVAVITAIDVLYSRRLSRGVAVIETTQTITVNRAPEECYRAWRDLKSLPLFMRYLESVELSGGARSHWVATGPAGARIEWDAEIVDDQPNESFSWCSLPGALVDNAGTVSFTRAAGGRGTIVTVQMRYQPPAGALGAEVAKLFGKNPQQQAREELRRFKQIMETGEVATTRGQPTGRRSALGRVLERGSRR